ncbi:glycerol-3-phosphate dehydrogenase [Gemmobacter aquarius]|uniref:Glycerol-3-phosphate dehydrogenase [NAD(P)+] n=1 Tax=Paragemmobacter aquarius TaxID=2169400 RepID=A0A2S0UQG2_9RHOB|nr:NAD(P)H-dependent glycerol-3-phosphate dehydrogenase [Gemmobacter aquarius]AWB50041.1 glycerol-3-phosphate dehydrogenase [Gemmobacter aquarius]
MIGVVGAGAFGTALAVALGREGYKVRLWGRDVGPLAASRMSDRLGGVRLPDSVTVTAELSAMDQTEAVLLALPMQAVAGFLRGSDMQAQTLVACCKGVDLQTLTGPATLMSQARPKATVALLTGPSFAADIARGLPTALTLACADDAAGQRLQRLLSTPVLRLYRTVDVTGAELGGALKNVIAIAAGTVIGAGLGESARAALMTRGYAEMVRLALALGARAETLAGLSGFGDLVLTCGSAQSRNFSYGHALGAGTPFNASVTVEGVATARAVARLGIERGIDLPVTAMVAALVDGRIDLSAAIQSLLTRPLKAE